MPMLEVRQLQKTYAPRFGGSSVQALRGVTLDLEEGEFAAIMGESGSGKTTLLNILAALDRPTGGQVLLDGVDMARIREKDLAAFRRDKLGFVFQEFNLLDTFSLKDNIFLPLVLAGRRYEEMEAKLAPLARRLEITELLDKYPYEVSGGQKQRCAVARALITDPRLVLADEPTGALDSRSAEQLLRLMEDVNQKGQTIVMVTHSIQAASHASRVLFIKDGVLFHQLRREGRSEGEFYAAVSQALTLLQAGGGRCG